MALMKHEKILLADDDAQMLAMLSEFLRGLGYAVSAVPDGWQAMEALKATEFHLAVLDLKLPGYSGLDLLSYVKANAPRTEVILFTGHGGVDSAIQALRLGAYDYLLKADLRLVEFQAVVSRALERRRLSQSNRELLNNLRQAQKELSKQRCAELTHVRRIGEALAVPLTWEQLFHGLLNMIWETVPLDVLGIQFQGAHQELSLEAYRRHPSVSNEEFQDFKGWLQVRFDQECQEAPEGPAAEAPVKPPLAEMLCEKAQVDEVLAVIGGGRGGPFTPEEQELFHIFVLQGEAALKNLVLFEEVKSLAIRDGLTGLYNYRHFWEMLVHEVELSRRYGKPLSMLFLDLDNFKVINDTLGHPQGDVVLKTLAAYLKSAVRHADVVCRYGGEEFVLLLPHTAPAQAMLLAERLRQKISELTIPLPNRDLQFTVSIGVAGLTDNMTGADLLDTADAALYRAKQAGRNKVCGPEGVVAAAEGEGVAEAESR
jgi:diguanylate cyclase (GGDEF)-like protein